ncbi:hypothetical protein M426DRAFT_319760 [Hypoxylon sp. CI-4A]|nr:hypothetical protein M426DRAFT_319760 [Hypoxylon sp. CI-4A]
MESSPLIKAHDHAKAASIATQTSDTTVAINEHTRAAGEFANAAKTTSSVEALRTLKLLEQHHQRLSELLQLPNKSPSSQATSENDSQSSEKDEVSPGASSATPLIKHDAPGTEKNSQPLPTLPRQPRYPPRDLGASIANNLASARGIRSKYRSQPLSPSVSNTEAPGNMEAGSQRNRPKTKMQNMLDNSDRPNTHVAQEKERAARQSISTQQETASNKEQTNSQTNVSDEGFSRFYSAFGSIINRISAPLAFAGLPLITEEQPEASAPPPESPAPKRNRTRVSATVSAEPDLKKIYSKAALRAVARDGQSANDSFYVVPTSGHTASYASILTFADKEKRRMEAQGVPADPDEEDFVDARESQVPRSPALQRFAGRGQSNRDLVNLVEELHLENKGLKDMLDKVSKRLHAFESNSQNQGMRLAESMRFMRPSSPLAPAGGGKAPALAAVASSSSSAAAAAAAATVSDEVLAKRNQELEEQIKLMSKRMEHMEDSYNKAKTNLIRYREKWDQLKAGAKARRAGASSSAGGQGGSEMGTDDGLKSPGLA